MAFSRVTRPDCISQDKEGERQWEGSIGGSRIYRIKMGGQQGKRRVKEGGVTGGSHDQTAYDRTKRRRGNGRTAGMNKGL